MIFEWDDHKEQINIAKHGIDFKTAARVFQDEFRIEIFDELHSDIEERYITIGQIGGVGSTLLHELMHKADCPVENHQDCGCLLYDVAAQNVQAGGSGAGCSAAVLAAHVLPGLVERRWRRVLFLSTGALMSQTTFLQGESIPGIAHCVELGCPEEEGNT